MVILKFVTSLLVSSRINYACQARAHLKRELATVHVPHGISTWPIILFLLSIVTLLQFLHVLLLYSSLTSYFAATVFSRPKHQSGENLV